MTIPTYFVHGVALVGAQGTCEACQQRPAIGPSISGLAVCARCAKDYAQAADELAREVTAQ